MLSYARRRARVIAALGNQCEACGEAVLAFLAIDHRAGGGRAHRLANGLSGGPSFYREVERSGPDASVYGVLCHNCNHKKSLTERSGRRVTCTACADESCRMCRERAAARTRAARTLRERRAEVLSALGGDCRCCGIKDTDCLAIDHINEDGAEHRREIGLSSMRLIKAVMESGPDHTRFQILCHNCNFAKSHQSGGCPHAN